ncbi:odorant receptor 10a-like [Diachasmimorpha longicaudata]|uniref:odorant receptor 10a-like n=1 Tax=Diachasmimorpha longicaudata TaxID=58733 RepID=UPI0030B8C68A
MEYSKQLHPQWNVDIHYALDFSKWWCKALGIWPWRNNDVSCIMQASSIVLIVITAAAVSSIQLLTKGNCGVITDLLDSLASIIVFSGTAIKILSLLFHQQHMRYIISSIIDDWWNNSGTKSRKIMRRYTYWGRAAFILQIAGTFAGMVLTTWTDPPTLKTEMFENDSSVIRHLLLAPSCWIPITMPLNIYLLYYNVIFIAMICSALTYAGCDAFMFNAALHICGQFEILEANIASFSDEDDYSMQKYKIRKFSKRHDELIQLGKHMDTLINVVIFSELVSNSILICASGIVVMEHIKAGNVNRVVFSWIARIYVWHMEFFMYCYVGEKLSSHADKLRSTLFNCPWYTMSTHIAKDIKFMMMRNNYFCHLTAGEFLMMNYESFAKITKAMFSLFSVLRFMLQ